MSGAVTFLAVYAAYRLSIKEDRDKEKRELQDRRSDLLELFKFDLKKISEFLKSPSRKTTEKINSDAWDVAKATGFVSTLKLSELETLSEIYVEIRRINQVIDDPRTIGIIANLDTLTVESAERQLLVRIENAQKSFGWLDKKGTTK